MRSMRRGYFTPPVLIILAVIIFAVAILIAINTDLVKRIKKEPSPAPISSPSPISDTDREPTGSAETANWKIYTNQELNFSIKYPQAWFLYDNKTPPCSGEIPEYVFINKTQLSGCIFPDFVPADFYVFVDEPFNPPPTSNQYDVFTPYKIAGKDGVINFRTEKSEGPRAIDTAIFVNHNNRGYLINFPNNDYKGNHDKIYDQILSTFQFKD